MNRFFVYIMLILLIYGCKNSTNNENDTPIDINISFDNRLTPIIEKVMVTHGIPGLSIGVVKANEIIYLKGFGQTSIETKETVTPNTLFHVASISKVFVGTAIMQLVEEGKIDLDEKLVHYLPDFKLKGDSYKEITIRQMLGHFSGMPNSNSYNWDKPEYDNEALERYVKSLSDFEMEHTPGEKFRYSNIAYEVLGHLIHTLSGKHFCDYQKEMILEKAGMHNSSFLKPEKLPGNWASPHEMGLETFVLDFYPFNRRHAPSSTLHTNAEDMCNWILVNLNKGSFNQYHILHEQSIDSMWTQQIEFDRNNKKYGVGLSWFIEECKGHRKISHHGDDDGFQAGLTLLPEDSIGVIIMANTLPAPIDELTNSVVDILLGSEPTPIKPMVGIPAMRVLKEEGLEEAVRYWKDIELNHSEEYDFNTFQYFNLYFEVMFGEETKALKIAELYSKVLKKEEKEYLIDVMNYALEKRPKNKLPLAIIERLKKQN